MTYTCRDCGVRYENAHQGRRELSLCADCQPKQSSWPTVAPLPRPSGRVSMTRYTRDHKTGALVAGETVYEGAT